MKQPVSMRKAMIALGLGLLGLALFSSLLFAAGKTKVFTMEGIEVNSKKVGKYTMTTITDAVVTHEDAVFTANKMDVKSEGDVHEITCTGNPVLTDPENRITAEKVVAYSTPRQAEFVGNVKMVSTPKKQQQEGKDEIRNKLGTEPSTTTCDRLSYNYSAKRAFAKGNVKIVQKARTLWADEGTYDQNLELITLKGNVRLQNEGEEELKELKNAETATISLQNDWIDIVAKQGSRVQMIFHVKDDDQKPADDTAKPEEKTAK